MSNHFISLEQARIMKDRFLFNQDNVLAVDYQQQGILFTSETFERNAFDYLLNEPGAAGLRFYNGMDESFQTRLIAVAIDANGNDLLPESGVTLSGPPSGNQIVEEGTRCPTNCPKGLTL